MSTTKIQLTFSAKSAILLLMLKKNVLKIALIIWMIVVIAASFMYAKAAAGFPGETSRIMLFHVPQAWVATLAFLVSMIASIIYLRNRSVHADLTAAASAELGFLFCILATVTGSLFAKVTWGSYWNWDPRETSIVILLMIYGAYFALRSAVPDQDRKRVFAAAYSIMAFATVPFLIFILPRITVSLHPEDTMNPVDPQMDIRFMLTFIGAFIAYTGLYVWMIRLKFRASKIEENLTEGIEEWIRD